MRLRNALAAAGLVCTAALVQLPTAAPASALTTTLGQRAVSEARLHVGQPYRYGAAGPTRFDCSGFTLYVFSRLGRSLPHNAAMQYGRVRHIPNADKQIGDLIFTRRSDGSIGHVGIYAGGSDIWASVQTGDVVRRQSFAGRGYAVGRVA